MQTHVVPTTNYASKASHNLVQIFRPPNFQRLADRFIQHVVPPVRLDRIPSLPPGLPLRQPDLQDVHPVQGGRATPPTSAREKPFSLQVLSSCRERSLDSYKRAALYEPQPIRLWKVKAV